MSAPPLPQWAQKAPVDVRARIPKLAGLPQGSREESLSASHSYANSRRLGISHRSGAVTLRTPTNRSPREGSQTDRGPRHGMTGKSLPSLKMSEISQQAGAALERAAELDNWPSTQSVSSHSWLSKLEAMLDAKLQSVEQDRGSVLDTTMVYDECFGYFIELFKTYQPFLARIHNGYKEVVRSGLAMQQKLETMEADLFAVKKRSEEDMLRTVSDLKQQIHMLEKQASRSDATKERLLTHLKESEENLKATKIETDAVKQAYDRSLEVSRAYCSGYKWIVKNVQKSAGQDAEEMPDLDALDNVTLIQRLERSQAENNASRWQIDYLSSTSEIAYIKSILEEERRLFGQEQERMQMELDQLRGSESHLIAELDSLENKYDKLDAEHKELRNTMDSTFLASWGDSKEIPPFLRTRLPVLYRPIDKGDLNELLRDTIDSCRSTLQDGKYPDVLEELVRSISSKYAKHSMAEFGRNVLMALDQYRNEADCDLAGAILSEDLGPHALMQRTYLVPQLIEKLAIAYPGQDIVSVSEFTLQMPALFPGKQEPAKKAITNLLSERFGDAGGIVVERLRSPATEDAECGLVELLSRQLLDEVRVYSNSLRKEMIDAAQRTRKKQKAGLKISFQELKEALDIVEPGKKIADVAEVQYRGFNMASVEEAMAILAPDEEDQWDAKTKLEEATTTMDLVDRVMTRLSVANLLVPSKPDFTPVEDPDDKGKAALKRAASAQSVMSKAGAPGEQSETPSPEEAKAEAQKQAIKDAMEEALKACDIAPVARWAKVRDSSEIPERKPVLNSVVAVHRRELKHQASLPPAAPKPDEKKEGEGAAGADGAAPAAAAVH